MAAEPFRTVPLTPGRIAQFSAAMRDPNPVHLDPAFCASIGLPGVIAPGGMAVVALTHAAVRCYGVASIREVDVAFRSPVHAGERLTCELGEPEGSGAAGVLVMAARALGDDDRVCAEGTITVVAAEGSNR